MLSGFSSVQVRPMPKHEAVPSLCPPSPTPALHLLVPSPSPPPPARTLPPKTNTREQ